MKLFAAMVAPDAKLLDAGCGFKPWQQCFPSGVSYLGVDYSVEWSSPDGLASADHLPFKDNSFDAIICSEVLEHTRYPEKCIGELRRVCRPGGLIYISTPFCFPEHGVPYDFQRLTQYFYKDVFKNDEIVTLNATTSTLGSAFTTFNFFVECTPLRLVWGVRHLVYFCCNLLGLVCDSLINFFAPKIMRTLKLYTHMLPLGYNMIIRVDPAGKRAE
jgi:SAM-dependent methyltransferase